MTTTSDRPRRDRADRECAFPPHPENDERQQAGPAADSALSRFAAWVRHAPAERAPLPAIPGLWAAAEAIHLVQVPVAWPAAGTVAVAGLAYGIASRRPAGDGEDGERERLSPGEVAAVTALAGGWLAVGDAAGPLAGGWPPWLTLGYLGAAGCTWCWLRMHSATRAARTRREKAAADAVLDVARKSGWHEPSELIGLKGSHLLSWEETYLGDRRLIDVRGTGQRATSLAGEDLAERIAELELLPRGRVEVYPDRIAGRLWIDVRRRDPWRRPVMHPCASGQHDPAAEFAEHVPQQATCREPSPSGSTRRPACRCQSPCGPAAARRSSPSPRRRRAARPPCWTR